MRSGDFLADDKLAWREAYAARLRAAMRPLQSGGGIRPQPHNRRSRATSSRSPYPPHSRFVAISAPSAIAASFLNEMSGSSLP